MRPPLTPPVPVAQQPLANQLALHPSLEAPAVANVSMRHMRAMATRANKSAGRNSVLRDYLATA